MITYDLSILNQKGTPMFYSDLTANRPAFGIVGRIFIATDSPFGIFRDTGSAWEQIAGSGGGGGNTIYTANDTLTGNRIVSDGGFGLSFTSTTYIGTAAIGSGSGKLIVGSSSADNGIQLFGANSPSLRLDNAQSGGTQRLVIGLSTAVNNFIQGSTAGQFCISTASSGAMLFGMWQSTNATEVMRITTSNNLLVGGTIDAGFKLDITGTIRSTGTISSNASNAFLAYDGGVTNQRFGIGTSTNTLNVFTGDTMIFGTQVDTSTSTKANSVMWFGTENNLIIGGATSSLGVNFKLQVTGRSIYTTGDTNNIITISNPTTSTNSLFNCTTSQYNAINFASNSVTFASLFGCGSSFSFGTYAANEMNLMSQGSGDVTLRINNVGNVNIKAKNSDVNNSTTQFKLFGTTGNIALQDGGTYSDTGQKLQITGAIRINGQSSVSAGGSAGLHLIVNVDGTNYKIALLNV